MSIRRHLQLKARDAFTNLQVKMETVLVEEVKQYMKLDEVSWSELLTASFRAYLDESRIVYAEMAKKEDDGISKISKSSSTPQDMEVE